jgi:putative FmdB family regulatory protein
MPTYDYECKQCGYTFEHFQSMSDNPLVECPECRGTLRRLIGGGMGIIFKGSGFYVTDNRSGNRTETESKPTTDTPQASAGSGSNNSGSPAPAGAKGSGGSDKGSSSS